jgi:hypothetical protein
VPPPLLALEARRVDDHVLDPVCLQEAVEPEALTPRFVATVHPRLNVQPVPSLRPRDLLEQCLTIARCNRTLSNRLRRSRLEAQLPGVLTDLQRQVQRCTLLDETALAGRCLTHELLLVVRDLGWSLIAAARQLTYVFT